MTDAIQAAPVPLGVCILGEPGVNRGRAVSYPGYVFEILDHAGVFHARVPLADLESRLEDLAVLVTVGEADLEEPLRRRLAAWVEAGGRWLAVGGSGGLEELLGIERVAPTYGNWGGGPRSLGEGYLAAVQSRHPMLAHLDRPLHYFGGAAVAAAGATVLATGHDAHGRPTDLPVLLERTVGRGGAVYCAIDLTGTVVLIQQGLGISRDGVPAPDGTAPINDGVLKSDDGIVLDWIFDREPVAGAEGLSIFTRPIADLWRDLLLRGIFHLAGAAQVPLPVLWYWPCERHAIGHLSHDTDGNDPGAAEVLLNTLAATGVTSTWCVILPGYGPKLMAQIAAAGHEFATHYDAVTPGLPFSAAEFGRQCVALTRLFGAAPVTNKNHYLRWEGDTELWNWCVANGIQLDQSKGPSKTGAAGYLFGTCHPYFPVRFDGTAIDVLELPTPTQDLVVFAPEAILRPLLAQALRSHGVLHLLFHPGHFLKADVVAAMATAIRIGQQAGLEWWTARRINAWERARRGVRLVAADRERVTLRTEVPLKDATILLLDPGAAQGSFSAWGCSFRSATTDLQGTQTITIPARAPA
jgi:hypothetical protein